MCNLLRDATSFVIEKQPKARKDGFEYRSASNIVEYMKKLGHKRVVATGIPEKYYKFLEGIEQVRLGP